MLVATTHRRTHARTPAVLTLRPNIVICRSHTVPADWYYTSVAEECGWLAERTYERQTVSEVQLGVSCSRDLSVPWTAVVLVGEVHEVTGDWSE